MDLLKDVEKRGNDYLSEIAREISNELEFSKQIESSISFSMGKVVDSYKIWNWTIIGVEGALTVAGVIAGFLGSSIAGPLGWAAFIVGSVVFFGKKLFEIKKNKIERRRRYFEIMLRSDIDKLCANMEKSLKDRFFVFCKKNIKDLCREMQRILNVMFLLCDEQKKMAWSINERVLEINKKVFEESLRLTDFYYCNYDIINVARIPGQYVLLELKDDTWRLPYYLKNELKNLMDENIAYIHERNNKYNLLMAVFGDSVPFRNLIDIDEKNGVAHISIEDDSPVIIQKVRLAQQLSELIITK